MPRPIDADALHHELVVEMVKCVRASEETKMTMAERVLNKLDEAPTIDPENLRPHGRWELREGAHPDGWEHHYCTSCEEEATFWYLMKEDYDEGLDGEWEYIGLRESGIEEILSSYCPNCGAKMDLEGT